MGKKMKVTDHMGEEYESVTAMCNKYNISTRLYYDRICRGFTLAEALGQERKTRKPKYTLEQLSEIHKIDIDTLKLGLSLGWGIKDIKDKLSTGNVYVDHTGKLYKSFNSMCDAWGVLSCTARSRLKKGLTLKYALTGEEEEEDNQQGKSIENTEKEENKEAKELEEESHE